jgi:quercetin dioxygenase-like cupin family protein
MDNKEYVESVNAGNFPEDIKVPIDPPYSDARGDITNLWLGGSGSVTLITSKAGSVRAQHYHTKGDWHSCYVISGQIKYSESEIDGSNLKEYTFNQGEMFFSPPEKWHKMFFEVDTIFLTVNGIVKNHSNYEASVVREKEPNGK